jgi:hypothetical protein
LQSDNVELCVAFLFSFSRIPIRMYSSPSLLFYLSPYVRLCFFFYKSKVQYFYIWPDCSCLQLHPCSFPC